MSRQSESDARRAYLVSKNTRKAVEKREAEKVKVQKAAAKAAAKEAKPE